MSGSKVQAALNRARETQDLAAQQVARQNQVLGETLIKFRDRLDGQDTRLGAFELEAQRQIATHVATVANQLETELAAKLDQHSAFVMEQCSRVRDDLADVVAPILVSTFGQRLRWMFTGRVPR